MSKKNPHHLFWDLYSSKMRKLIFEHRHAKRCDGKEFSDEKLGIHYKIDISYNAEKQMFTDMKYCLKAPTFMIALLEALAELILDKDIKKCAKVRADDLLNTISAYEVADLYEDADVGDYIRFISRYVNHLLDSYTEIVAELVPRQFTTPDALIDFSKEGSGIEGFFELEKEHQIHCIEEVMEKDIRPYVALDEGNVKVKDLTKNGIVLIQYEGNCTSCNASSSTTLSAITSILKAKIHPTIEVLPYFS
jgi:NifU-like protein